MVFVKDSLYAKTTPKIQINPLCLLSVQVHQPAQPVCFSNIILHVASPNQKRSTSENRYMSNSKVSGDVESGKRKRSDVESPSIEISDSEVKKLVAEI